MSPRSLPVHARSLDQSMSHGLCFAHLIGTSKVVLERVDGKQCQLAALRVIVGVVHEVDVHHLLHLDRPNSHVLHHIRKELANVPSFADHCQQPLHPFEFIDVLRVVEAVQTRKCVTNRGDGETRQVLLPRTVENSASRHAYLVPSIISLMRLMAILGKKLLPPSN